MFGSGRLFHLCSKPSWFGLHPLHVSLWILGVHPRPILTPLYPCKELVLHPP